MDEMLSTLADKPYVIVNGMPLRVKIRVRALSVAFGLGLLMATHPAIAQTPLDLNGAGFRVERLASGAKAFSNRSYTWVNVPPRFEGWMFTRVKGGSAAEITVRSQQDGDLFIASVQQPSPDWQPVPGATFGYNDKYRTTLQVYTMHVAPQTVVSIPQHGWAGTLVLSPGLYGEARPEPTGTPTDAGVEIVGATPTAVEPTGIVVIKHKRHHERESAHAEHALAKHERKVLKREMRSEVKAQRRVQRAQAHAIVRPRPGSFRTGSGVRRPVAPVIRHR